MSPEIIFMVGVALVSAYAWHRYVSTRLSETRAGVRDGINPGRWEVHRTSRGRYIVESDIQSELFKRAQIGLLAVDAHRVLCANPAAEAILGHPSTELLSRPFHDFIYEEDLGRADEAIDENLSSGRGHRTHVNRWVGADGSIRLLRWTVSPFDAQGLAYCSVELMRVYRDTPRGEVVATFDDGLVEV